eukprot:scaffold329647_cov95-Tisochrysis_lutea.AAC.4
MKLDQTLLYVRVESLLWHYSQVADRPTRVEVQSHRPIRGNWRPCQSCGPPSLLAEDALLLGPFTKCVQCVRGDHALSAIKCAPVQRNRGRLRACSAREAECACLRGSRSRDGV